MPPLKLLCLAEERDFNYLKSVIFIYVFWDGLWIETRCRTLVEVRLRRIQVYIRVYNKRSWPARTRKSKRRPTEKGTLLAKTSRSAIKAVCSSLEPILPWLDAPASWPFLIPLVPYKRSRFFGNVQQYSKWRVFKSFIFMPTLMTLRERTTLFQYFSLSSFFWVLFFCSSLTIIKLPNISLVMN